jgi:hypothetical protein
MSIKSREDLVMVALRKHPGGFLCGGCLALGAGLSLQEARETMAGMSPVPDVEVRHGACSVCARILDLIGAVARR